MAAPCYIMWNGDTSALTGTSLKTMLQLKTGSSKARLVEWGYSFDVVPTAVVKVELMETGTVSATVTTISSGIQNYNDTTGASSLAVTGTSASGFTASAEGTVTSTRLLAYQHEWAQQFKQQFPLGREPEIGSGTSLRIRVTTATTINMSCYLVGEGSYATGGFLSVLGAGASFLSFSRRSTFSRTTRSRSSLCSRISRSWRRWRQMVTKTPTVARRPARLDPSCETTSVMLMPFPPVRIDRCYIQCQ
ncbi:hypothetical protein [Streptomyces nigrescens]